MKVCIVGAGAIGGYLGAKLAQTGANVTLIARGTHLQAIQERGLILRYSDGTEDIVKDVAATENMTAAGVHDVVIVTLKAQSVPSIAPLLPALYGKETTIVTAQNGIPWWYFRKLESPYADYRIRAVDPDGIVEANIPIDRTIGCIVYPAAEIVSPGVIRHIEGDRFNLGELDGSRSDRIQKLSQLFNSAGLKSRVRERIRNELWVKLWGNLAFNPISALTHATLEQICQYPPTRELAANMMREAQAIAEKLGVDFGISLEKRIAGAEGVGAHKTSMLQDIEAHRSTEVDAIVGSVAELGRLTQTPTPCIDAIYASVKLLEKTVTS
ncbi:2-dehydropantoate 2-reductase [Pseudanabaena sp. PCC 6802]|uniref:2-dehydropantoate 2-reductase n=1 Tax=Pseudanabaena sp. PCC 6802 TaxID=118173 RepID=UPI00034843F6|nr:2-dehydropantoate 2-reductase [Pseudanabaena sp. PCC 6802]